MIAFASSTTGGNRRLVEWDPRNLYVDFNTRYDLFTPHQKGLQRRDKKIFILVR